MKPAQYGIEMLEISERIVGAVRDDGPDELLRHIRSALAMSPPPGVDPVVALVTVLAAQVDPDTTAEQRVGWARAYGAPTPLPVQAALSGADAEQLVGAVVAGRAPLRRLPPHLRHVPVARLTARGMTAADIAGLVQCHENTVTRYRAIARAA